MQNLTLAGAIAIAMVLAWAIGDKLVAQLPQKHADERTQIEQAGTREQPTPNLTIWNRTNPKIHTDACGQFSGSDNEICQQRRIADSVEHANRLGTIFNLIDSLLLFAAVAIASLAALWAKRSADEGRIANQLIRDEKRPWLDVRREPEPISANRNERRGITSFFSVSIRNHGSTPAVFHLHVLPAPHEIDGFPLNRFADVLVNFDEIAEKQVIFPSETFSIPSTCFHPLTDITDDDKNTEGPCSYFGEIAVLVTYRRVGESEILGTGRTWSWVAHAHEDGIESGPVTDLDISFSAYSSSSITT